MGTFSLSSASKSRSISTRECTLNKSFPSIVLKLEFNNTDGGFSLKVSGITFSPCLGSGGSLDPSSQSPNLGFLSGIFDIKLAIRFNLSFASRSRSSSFSLYFSQYIFFLSVFSFDHIILSFFFDVHFLRKSSFCSLVRYFLLSFSTSFSPISFLSVSSSFLSVYNVISSKFSLSTSNVSFWFSIFSFSSISSNIKGFSSSNIFLCRNILAAGFFPFSFKTLIASFI